MPRASDVTSREAVRAAMSEFDQLGRDAFLAKYGFGPSREYVVVEDGRQYDSKALLGAAYAHQFDGPERLRSDDFSGGDETRRVLERLGFRFTSIADGDVDSTRLPARGIRDGIEQILDEYSRARAGHFGSSAEVWGTFEGLNQAFNTSPPVMSRPTVSAVWSAGRGNWARIPWISFLDARETRTTQRGVYPVLLFREDLSGAYLSIAQGVTEPGKLGRAGMIAHLESVAFAVRRQSPELSAAGFELNSVVDLKTSASLGRNYEHSVITHKLYEKGLVPNDEDILSDLEAVLIAYDRYIDNRPGVEVDVKLDLPNAFLIYVGARSETNLRAGVDHGVWGFQTSPADMLGLRVGDIVVFAVYTGGSPSASLTDWTKRSVRRLILGRVTRAAYVDSTPLWEDEATPDRAYPHRFTFDVLGTHEDVPLGGDEAFSEVVVAQLRLSAIHQGDGYLAPIEGSPLLEGVLARAEQLAAVPFSEIADRFSREVTEAGLVLPEERPVACLAALIAKPFAIFTGLSGSGKTQLALRLGDWFGTAGSEPRHVVVAVRPDWTGPEALFGYEDALQPRSRDGRAAWHVPAPLEFMMRAVREPDRPYLMILDEMNLAHVERYFSDYLSAAESREPVLPNLERELSDGLQSWRLRPGAPALLPIPRNLWVVGTVNIDETTYMFSPKVLDRAFVFEFRVGSEELAAGIARPSSVPAADPAVLRSVVEIGRDDEWHDSHPHPARDQLVEELRSVHIRLAASGHEFGHRVMDESLRFAAIYSGSGQQDMDEVLDLIAMQKLLPRLHGSRRRLEPVLKTLMSWAGTEEGPEDVDMGAADAAARLPRAATKLRRMLASLRANQFVSFTE